MSAFPAAPLIVLLLCAGCAPTQEADQPAGSTVDPAGASLKNEGLPPGPGSRGERTSAESGAGALPDPLAGLTELWSRQFALRPRDFVRLVVEQRGVDVAAKVFDPKGQLVLSVDALNQAEGPEDVPLLASTAGRYAIRIFTAKPRSRPGGYSVLSLERRVATPVDEKRWRAAQLIDLGYSSSPKGVTSSERVETLRQAVALFREVEDRRGEADALYRLGAVLTDANRFPEAGEALEAASPLYVQLADLHQQLVVDNDLGRVWLKFKDLDRARSAFEAALRLARRLEKADDKSTIRKNLGQLLTLQGKFSLARRVLEEELRESQARKDPFLVASALNCLGQLEGEMGEGDRAIELHRKALNLLGPKRYPNELARTFLGLGNAYDTKHDSFWAVHYLERARLIYKNNAYREREATVLNNLAVVRYNQDRIREAVDAQNRALEIYLELNDGSSAAIAWANVGFQFARQGRPGEALAAYQKARALTKEGERPALDAVIHLGLAEAARARKNYDEAIREVDAGIRIIEGMRDRVDRGWTQATFQASNMGYYDLRLQLEMERLQASPRPGQECAALEIELRSRARSLYEGLAKDQPRPPLTVKDVQGQLLDPDTLLLQYSLGREMSYLWAVARDSCRVYPLPKRAVLEPALRAAALQLERTGYDEELPAIYGSARALSQTLLGPLGKLPKQSVLVIVAPPEMQSIPFAALPDPFSIAASTAESPWPHPLLETKLVVWEPSMPVLAEIRSQEKQRLLPSRLLAVLAAPNADAAAAVTPTAPPPVNLGDESASFPSRQEFPPIGNWREEVEAIRGAASGQPIEALTGDEATVQQVESGRLQGFRILHFIAHGVFDEDHPERSALLLSPGPASRQDPIPFLTVEKIARLRLPADLVVLSSCRAARGREVRGEGVIGLSQAFLLAGASRLIASVFEVQNADAQPLMRDLYSELLRGGRSPAQALRNAQLRIWRQPGRQAPANWAGFVMLGDWLHWKAGEGPSVGH